MVVTSLKFEEFRNFQSLDLNFHQGFVVLTGKNGAGKTNFLEGLYLGATLRRFPDSQLDQLFGRGKDYFRIRVKSTDSKDNEQTTQELFSEKTDGHRKLNLKVNNQAVLRQAYLGHLSVVVFLPEDLNIFTHSPRGRRRYLDGVLAAVSAEYRQALFQYERVLHQRNEILQQLKLGQRSVDELFIWDQKLVEFGSLLTDGRSEFMNYLNENFTDAIKVLSPDLVGAHFNYESSGFADQRVFLEKLNDLRQTEIERAATLLGPHRDDFKLFQNHENLVGFISRGQMRAAVLVLKILEKEFVSKHLGRSPALLLDDVLSEFDEQHQKALVAYLKGFSQVFLTTAHWTEIERYFQGIPFQHYEIAQNAARFLTPDEHV